MYLVMAVCCVSWVDIVDMDLVIGIGGLVKTEKGCSGQYSSESSDRVLIHGLTVAEIYNTV